MQPSFIRQTDQPLFPQVFWDRPTMRRRAGRLLLVGGHEQRFDLVQAAYQAAEAAGIGECRAAMPDSLRHTIGPSEFAQFVPAAPSGSLGKAALSELLTLARDVDALVIGLNLTANAETAIMIEKLAVELETPIIFTEEAIELFSIKPELITGNPRALVATSMNGLFALANHHHLPIAIKPGAGVLAKITILQQLAAISRCDYFVFDGEILAQAEGQTSLTPLARDLSTWPAAAIATAATFWLQQRTKPFTGLAGAAFVLAEAARQIAAVSEQRKPEGDKPQPKPNYTQVAAIIQAALKQLDT